MRLAAFLLCLPAIAQVSSKSAISSRTSISTSRPSSGSGLSLTVVGVSNTQAIVSYTAPSSSACTVEASESATYLPVVHDVDGALFTGAASDARDGNLGAGTTTRVIRVGTRKAERALDGFMTSRALQTVTPHYVRVTCGASVGTATFTTANIKLGTANYNEPYEGNSEIASLPYTPKAGLYAWPDFHSWDKDDVTARPETVIDPKTGVSLKRIGLPADKPRGSTPSQFGDQPFTNGIGSAWTNPNNIVVDDTASATYSGSGQAFIFLRSTNFLNFTNSTDLFNEPSYQFENITLSLKAWCSSGGTCATGDNAKVEACLTVNGVTCWPDNAHAKFQTATLGTSALPSSYVTLGTATAILDSWTPTGYQPINRIDAVARSGTADVDVSGNVTWVGGSNGYFNPSWIAGSKATINGQECAILSVSNPKLMQIDTGSCVLSLPLTATAWSAGNFGFLLRHKTTSTDQINIQYARFTTSTSEAMSWSASGSVRYCSETLTQNSVTLALGYHCVFESTQGTSLLYWIKADTGDANFLGTIFVNGSGGADGWTGGFSSPVLAGTTSTADETFYTTKDDNSGKRVLLGCSLQTTNQTGSIANTCSNMTLGSTGHDLNSLVAAFTAGDPLPYDPALFYGLSVVGGTQNGKVLLAATQGGQDTVGWTVMFDPALVSNAAGCVGSPLPGCVVAAQTSFNVFPCRWCAIHTSFNSGNTDTAYVAGQVLEGQDGVKSGQGPFQVTMTTHLTATPGLSPGSGGCPAGTLSCDAIVIDGEPCDATPVGTDPLNCPKNGSWSYLQPAAVGDILQIDTEYIRLAVKTNATHWIIQRGYPAFSPANHPSTLILTERCTSTDFTFGSSMWDWTWDTSGDPHGQNAGGTTVVIAAPYDHVLPSPFVTFGGYGGPNGGNPCTVPECYAVHPGLPIGAAATQYQAMELVYNGVIGIGSTIFAEDHPGRLQDGSIPAETNTFLDARRLTVNDELMDGASPVTGTLYKYTSTTSDGDNLTSIGTGGGNRLAKINRKLNPQFAYSSPQPLRDISSPATGNIITGDSTTAYTYCIARKATECRTASTRGDIYMNSPIAVTLSTGRYGCKSYPDNGDSTGGLCITNNSGYVNDIVQIGFDATDYAGALGRSLSGGLARFGPYVDNFWNAKQFTNSSWVIFRSFALGGVWHDALALKLPPFPTPDGVDRTNYLSQSVSLATPSGMGIDNAIIKFGYTEFGAPTNFYCTSRADTCYANATSITVNNPFKFAEDGSGAVLSGLAGVSCASSCTIPIPAVSQRALYYQAVYRDASNNIVTTGAVQLVMTQ